MAILPVGAAKITDEMVEALRVQLMKDLVYGTY